MRDWFPFLVLILVGTGFMFMDSMSRAALPFNLYVRLFE